MRILFFVAEEDGWGHYPRAVEYPSNIKNIKVVAFPDRGHEIYRYGSLVLPHVIEFLDE